MLEMDCHLTRDGHVVVSHDENLLRQTGHDADISSLNLQVRGRILQGRKGHKVQLRRKLPPRAKERDSRTNLQYVLKCVAVCQLHAKPTVHFKLINT